jgi:7-cyano-7-deazaguanine synthase
MISSRRFVENAKLEELVKAAESLGTKIVYLEDLAQKIGALKKLSGFLAAAFPLTYLRRVNAADPKDAAVVLFSGGQDSTTCLFWAKKQFKTVYALSFVYGQKHVHEVELARGIAERAGVEFHVMDVSFIGHLGKNSLTDTSIHMDEEKPKDSFPNTFVPGRNLFFLSIAAVYAREKGIHHMVTGVSQTDFSGYPDCRDSFIKSLNVTLNLAMDEQFILHTPLMWINKAQTWALADELGILDVVRNETLTCYNGVPADGCGHCPACKLRRQGLDEYLKTKK